MARGEREERERRSHRERLMGPYKPLEQLVYTLGNSEAIGSFEQRIDMD